MKGRMCGYSVTMVICVFMTWLFIGSVFAVEGVINGVVNDNGGKPVASAIVKLKSLSSKNKNKEYKVQTDEHGHYTFNTIEAGIYNLVIRKDGYKKHKAKVKLAGVQEQQNTIVLQRKEEKK